MKLTSEHLVLFNTCEDVEEKKVFALIAQLHVQNDAFIESELYRYI